MTTPVSLPVAVATPTDSPTTPGTTDATDDAFAAVLAALSGAIGAPVPQLPTQAVPTEQATSGSAVDGACGATGSPTAWSAATQRQTVPGIAPTTTDAGAPPVDDTQTPVGPGHRAGEIATATGPVGAWHPTHGTEVRATKPAGAHAPFQRLATTGAATGAATDAPAADPTTPAAADESGAPAVPVVADATPQPAAAATQVAATATPMQVDSSERPHGVGPAKHVQPAVVEAARGLRHEGGGRTSLVVRLDPPELGAVLVRLTVQDGRVDVQLRTPDLVARQDLQAQQQDVQQVLKDQGFDLSSFDVAHGDVFPGNQGDSPDRGTPQRSHRADGRMDDHHPVTDDGPAPEPSGTWL